MAGIDFSKYRIILSDEDTRASSIMLDSWLQGSYSSDLHAVDGFIAGFYRGIWYARQGDRVDDGTRLENERAAKSPVGSNPTPAYTDQIKFLRKQGFYKNQTAIIDLYRKAIRYWLDFQGFNHIHTRIELGKDNGYFTIFSNKGKVKGSRSNFLNKITVDTGGNIISHRATTDDVFLKPFDAEFNNFIVQIMKDTK